MVMFIVVCSTHTCLANSRDIDITDTYRDDPFQLGASGVTPVMSFREFMNLSIPDAYLDELFQLGARRVGEPSMDIDEL